MLSLRWKERRHSKKRELSVSRSLLLPLRPERPEGQPWPLKGGKEKLTDRLDLLSKGQSEPRSELLPRSPVLSRRLRTGRRDLRLSDWLLRRNTRKCLPSRLNR